MQGAASVTVTSAAIPIVRIAIVRYASFPKISWKASSDQSNGFTFPVNESLVQKAFKSRMPSDPR